jgi:acetyl esterase
MVKEFTEALVKAGQRAEYVQVGGAGHAFFDWKPDDATKATFAKYGVYYAAGMKAFFESVLYEGDVFRTLWEGAWQSRL